MSAAAPMLASLSRGVDEPLRSARKEQRPGAPARRSRSRGSRRIRVAAAELLRIAVGSGAGVIGARHAKTLSRAEEDAVFPGDSEFQAFRDSSSPFDEM